MARDYDEIMRAAQAEAAKPRLFTTPPAPAYKKPAGPATKTSGYKAPQKAPAAPPRSPFVERLSEEQTLEGGRGQGIFRARSYSGTSK